MFSFVKEWIYRFRHNRGFGVQSPAAFYFVMHVLRECKHSYYSYAQLNRMACEGAGYNAVHLRRLFRISNYFRPYNIISFAKSKDVAAEALKIGAVSASYIATTSIEELTGALETVGSISLLHIGNTPHCATALKKALSYTNKKSVIIIENLTDSNVMQCYKEAVAMPQVRVSMDMYGYGILLFDTEYKKQHYTFCFK